ncbi:MAG TPA: CoA ester lyase [Acidimicrobiales bacterium]|nr:CoA ester lyase [Acidimicrobiales bacterium]
MTVKTTEPSYRPRRSVLYMPGANARALEKAQAIPADALILDLEDAVAPDAKPEARDRVCEAVQSGAYGRRELAIRANGIGTPWHDDDLRAIAQAGPAAVVVPKVNSAAEVHKIESALEKAGAPDHTKVWAMLETPVAMLHAEGICAASERLTVLVMGTNDLIKELHGVRVADRHPLLPSLGLSLLAARATGKVILDGVYNDIKDADGFLAECRQGREMGFDGKTLIHPGQVEPCNEAFAPTADDVELAQRIIAAFDEAQAEGRGVVTVDGRMIENLHVDEARRVLAIQAAIDALSES